MMAVSLRRLLYGKVNICNAVIVNNKYFENGIAKIQGRRKEDEDDVEDNNSNDESKKEN